MSGKDAGDLAVSIATTLGKLSAIVKESNAVSRAALSGVYAIARDMRARGALDRETRDHLSGLLVHLDAVLDRPLDPELLATLRAAIE